MNNIELIRERLKQRIQDKGLSFREVSLKIGRRETYIQQYIKYGLPKRLNEYDRKRICLILDMDEKELIDDKLADEIPLNSIETPNNNENFVSISIYAGRLGDHRIGKLFLNEQEFQHYTNIDSENISIARIDGDYMNPTLPYGSLVLYDTTIKHFESDGVYIIKEDNIISIKRLQKKGNDSYKVLTDNKNYPPYIANKDELIILGRAIRAFIDTPL